MRCDAIVDSLPSEVRRFSLSRAPALHMRQSIFGSRVCRVLAAALTCEYSLTSASTILTLSLAVNFTISSLASSARSFDRQIIYTLAPFAAAYVVISFPNPELALHVSIPIEIPIISMSQ